MRDLQHRSGIRFVFLEINYSLVMGGYRVRGAPPYIRRNLMRKPILCLSVLALMVVSLTGCTPRMRSMGASVENAPITHRADASNKAPQMQLDATGFVSMSDATENVSDVAAAGGTASFTYRMGGGASFLFFNAALSGFHGKLNFDCTDEDCDDPDDSYYRAYQKWLKTPEGGKRYDFTNLQERLLISLA